MTEDWDNLLWTEVPLLTLDFETTGLTSGDRICEVAFVVSRGREVLDRYSALVNPQVGMNPGATGITEDMVRGEPTFEELFPEFERFFYMDIPWISHNMPFDMRMLNYSWPVAKWPHGIPSLCTLAYSRVHPTTRMRSKHKLLDLANYFGVEYDSNKLHAALYDTELLAMVVPLLMGGRKIGPTMSKYNHEWIK